MTREMRRNELIQEMEETGIMMKDKYFKAELEQGYREFQKMMLIKVFDEKHAKTLRIDDIINHLYNLACDLRVENAEELRIFMDFAKEFKKTIALEIAGNKGERAVNRAIKMVLSKKHVISNIEFCKEEICTECDKIVITNKGIFLIEVKTAKHNMMITEDGNYVREDGAVYGNIGEKVNEKVYLVKNAMEEWAVENSKKINIVKIVVFANNDYTLQDNYKFFQSCYCCTLPHVIDDYEGENLYTDSDMEAIKNVIERASEPMEYKLNFEFDNFRYAFADLVAMLEQERELQIQRTIEEEEKRKRKEKRRKQKKIYKKIAKVIGYGVAASASVFLGVKAIK